MEVVAFVGSSGTGKSHRALVVAHENKIECIIDDGILIHDNKIVAVFSAKKESSRLKAVRRAIFQDEVQVKSVREQLDKIKKSGTKAVKERLERIFLELAYTPMNINGFALPEKLRNYPNEEVWSRELSKKDRVVYQVYENIKTIIVLQLLGHYNDK